MSIPFVVAANWREAMANWRKVRGELVEGDVAANWWKARGELVEVSR
ncbi:hypothetical protein [Plantactinospora sp. BC1]|nr:hypothetical protein [Plantactinospora sp. BC1]